MPTQQALQEIVDLHAEAGKPLSAIQIWRLYKSQTINHYLSIARTSYLNLRPQEAKKHSQKRLLELRLTRPAF